MSNDMSLFDYFKKSYTENVFNFKGRARRKEYWGTELFYLLFFIPIFIIFGLMVLFVPILLVPISLISWILSIPMLFLGIRRLHDINCSGWFILILVFVDILSMVAATTGIGIVLLTLSIVFHIALGLIPGTPGKNKYGADPKMNAEFIDVR